MRSDSTDTRMPAPVHNFGGIVVRGAASSRIVDNTFRNLGLEPFIDIDFDQRTLVVEGGTFGRASLESDGPRHHRMRIVRWWRSAWFAVACFAARRADPLR